MSSVSVAIDLRLAGYRTGGIARYGTELAEALSRLNDVNVVELRSKHDDSGGTGAVELHTPPHHRLERYAIPTELLLKRARFDIYHAIDFVAPKVRDPRIVATVHDLEFLRHPEYLDDDALRYYNQIKESRDWTDAWITPSQWTADDLSQSLDIPPDCVTVIPHGTPAQVSLVPPVPRDQREPFLLAVSTVEPRKRYGLLLDALSSMETPPALRIVGREGWNASDAARRLASTPGVQWRTDVQDAELWQLYRQAYAVVIPSMSEGFGMMALEAMAAGTPVISSGHGALPEVTGRAALVPETDDAAGWATAIEQVLDDEHLWNELSAFGQRRASGFTWRRAAESTAGVYRQVLKR